MFRTLSVIGGSFHEGLNRFFALQFVFIISVMAETIFYLAMTIQLIYGFMAGRRKGAGTRKTEMINAFVVVFLFLMNVAPAHQFYGLIVEVFTGPSDGFRGLVSELRKPVGAVPGWVVVTDFWGSLCISLLMLLDAILLARREERARKSILVLFPIACLSAILSFWIGLERAREGATSPLLCTSASLSL
jgi:hypothetical protein